MYYIFSLDAGKIPWHIRSSAFGFSAANEKSQNTVYVTLKHIKISIQDIAMFSFLSNFFKFQVIGQSGIEGPDT